MFEVQLDSINFLSTPESPQDHIEGDRLKTVLLFGLIYAHILDPFDGSSLDEMLGDFLDGPAFVCTEDYFGLDEQLAHGLDADIDVFGGVESEAELVFPEVSDLGFATPDLQSPEVDCVYFLQLFGQASSLRQKQDSLLHHFLGVDFQLPFTIPGRDFEYQLAFPLQGKGRGRPIDGGLLVIA